MMKAQTAKQTAIRWSGKEIKAINKLIDKACSESKLQVTIDNMSEAAQAYYIENGYTVTPFTNVNKTQYIINWE